VEPRAGINVVPGYMVLGRSEFLDAYGDYLVFCSKYDMEPMDIELVGDMAGLIFY